MRKFHPPNGSSKSLIPKRFWIITILIMFSFFAVIGILYYMGLYAIASNFLSVASLVVAILTLIATVVIAIYIYNRQRCDEEDEVNSRKNAAIKFIGTALDDAVQWVINEPTYREIGPCYRLKEYLNRYENIIADFLTHVMETFFLKRQICFRMIHKNL